MKTLKAVSTMIEENKELRARVAKLEAELKEFYQIRELMNSINNNIDDDIIPFEDTIDTLEVNLKDDDIPFNDDIDVVEFDTPIPTKEDIEIPDFTEFLPQEETKEEETFKINPNDEGIDEDLLAWAIEQAGIKEEPKEEVKTEDKEEIKEEKNAPELLKEVVKSKSTIELLDRREKDFDSPDDIAKYISNILDNYSKTETPLGEENPLLKDIKSVYSFVSKALKRDSLKHLKDVLEIEEGFKVETRYRLGVMNALKDIKYILEYQDEPLSNKQSKIEFDDNEDKLLQLEEDFNKNPINPSEELLSKAEELANSQIETDLKAKIISFYQRESIKDTKERDLKLFEEMTEEQLKDRFVTDVNFQINALKQGWGLVHFKTAKDLDLDSVIPDLIGDELLTKMDLDVELLKLLN